MERTSQDTVRCPTCRAVQEWSDTCRRCRCDLTLLKDLEAAYRQIRRLALLRIRDGDPHEAFRHARYCHWLRPGEDSTRLLALCEFLCGRWAEAVGHAQDLADG